jgi:Ser/Thr protein kinase RdoA (MazF antagonist)
MHDGFFDRVTAGALERGVTQFVLLGPGHDGRAERHTRPDIRWWQPGVERGGLAAALTGSGFEPDAPALFCFEASASQLSRPALAGLLAELRSLATPGTRLALALPATAAHGSGTTDDGLAGGLFGSSRWRAVEISERAQRAGLRMLAPVWAPALPGTPPSAGAIAAFTERMLYRSGSESVASHLEAAHGVTVKATRELDLGVHRVDLASGGRWIARVFPAARDVEAVRLDARLLSQLSAAGFPAERCAVPEPVSVLDGQGVLVTECAPGRALAAKAPAFEFLGRLLGQLHAMPADAMPANGRAGGAWHHLLPDGSPADELAAARALLHDARHRVPAGGAARYDDLAAALATADACADLPHALVHPDCVPGNAISQPDGGVTLIDWAGAGQGPRIVSLGCLLWAAAGNRANVAAALGGYRESISLGPAEASRLGAAMRLRPLILACWTFATGRDTLDNVSGWWDHHRQRVDAVQAAITSLWLFGHPHSCDRNRDHRAAAPRCGQAAEGSESMVPSWNTSGLRPCTSTASTRPMAISWSPPGCTTASEQRSAAAIPVSSGRPSRRSQSRSANLSPPDRANAPATACWSAASTLTANRPVPRMCGQVVEVSAAQNSTSGGSRDSEVNELTASPTGPPPESTLVTTAIPVGQAAQVRRRSSGRTRAFALGMGR